MGHRADIEKMNSIVFEAGTDTDSLKHRTAELQASRYAARLQDQLKVSMQYSALLLPVFSFFSSLISFLLFSLMLVARLSRQKGMDCKSKSEN